MSSPARNRAGGKLGWLAAAAGLLALDQWSKAWIETHLPLHRSLEILPGFLAFTHVRNTGVAFGLLPAHGNRLATLLLIVLGLAAMAVILLYFRRTPATQHRLLAALACILGGAGGNLVDRVAAGAVTDFVDVSFGDWHFHTFNVADSAITVGIALMAIDLLFGGRSDALAGDGSGVGDPPAAPDAG